MRSLIEGECTKITKKMNIGEVLAIDEATAPIMMEYGMH